MITKYNKYIKKAYCEEDWSNFYENAKLDKVVKVIHMDYLYRKYKCTYRNWEGNSFIADELKKETGNYIKLKDVYGNSLFEKYTLLKNVLTKGIYNKGIMIGIGIYLNLEKYGYFPVDESLIILVKEPIRIITPEDPYGEEDWEVESKTYLEKEDFKVGDVIRSKMSKKIGIIHSIHPTGQWPILCRFNGPYVKFSQFYSPSDLEIYNGPKQIFSEQDPYGEEDWSDY